MKEVKEAIICAGFGGQGIMTLGKTLTNAGMESGYHVTWISSYGAEVRGGTAHCMVRIDTDNIGNPTVREADTAVIMNGPSMEKFAGKVKPGGFMIVNRSMVDAPLDRDDIHTVEVPLTDEAIKLGNVRVANMIAAGIYITKKKILTKDMLVSTIKKMAAGREQIIPVNIKAIERGIEIAESEGM